MQAARKAMEALDITQSFEDIFRYQYSLTKDPQDFPESWPRHDFDQWTLCHCARLQHVSIVDAAGESAGHLLGVAITPDGAVLDRALQLSQRRGAIEFWQEIDGLINELAGRYIVFITDGQNRRVYFDPVMDQACVFDPDSQTVASSLLLVLDRSLRPNPAFDIAQQIESGRAFSFSHTPDAHVKRGISNHYLDLDTFELVRHWPGADLDFAVPRGIPSDVPGTLVEKLGRNLQALVNHADCDLPLSGGYDSRNLLACLGPNTEKIGRVYCFRVNQMTSFDVLSAEEVARAKGIPLDAVDVFAPEYEKEFTPSLIAERKKAFFLASGLTCVPGHPADLVANFVSAQKPINIRGNVMDMIGGNQFKQLKSENEVDPVHGLRRLAICNLEDQESVEKWSRTYSAWASELPENARARVYDFAFLEQLLPNTLGGRGLIGLNRRFQINAFSDRKLIHIAARIRPRVRRRGALNQAIVRYADPELAAIPYTNHMKHDETWRRRMRQRFHPVRFFPREPLANQWHVVLQALG